MTTTIVIAALGFALIGLLIRWLVGKSESGARSEMRADALEANEEATRDAERHIDSEADLDARRRRAAARRRLRDGAGPG